ncbi:MAG TPA: DUF1559 domain-containing protein, partial [Planctomycetaceae bacterium]|nr:DUF1559 domain-containing protein [Planctomycetaceae bacterium]
EGKRMADFRDGTSMSIIVVEASSDQAVPWTKPEDLEISAEEALDALLSAHEGGFLALFADGSARLIPDSVDLDTLKNLFTIADGNPVDLD